MQISDFWIFFTKFVFSPDYDTNLEVSYYEHRFMNVDFRDQQQKMSEK
jgi:hypothetical protein